MHTHIPKDRQERPVGEGGGRRGERRSEEKGRKKIEERQVERAPRRPMAEYLRKEDSVFKFPSEREGEEHFPRYSCKIVDA